MANIFSNFADWFGRKTRLDGNNYNQTLYEFLGGQSATYDYKNREYLDKGFGMNPDVYAIVMQRAKKLSSIPFVIQDISDRSAKRKLDSLEYATKGTYSFEQLSRKKLLETKAYSEKELDFPLEQPNPVQSWTEIFSLYEVYMATTGNAYFYVLSPDDGPNKDVPKEVYILPSHLIEIVLKKDAKLIEDESPIDYYMLIDSANKEYSKFTESKVIHIKYPNPFFDLNGSHLYGLSPLKSVLRNIESSNETINGNVKTAKNRGVYGFLGSADKNQPLTDSQALQVKDKMREMDNNPGRLSNIGGLSVALAFTKLSLTTDELKPFDYLSYDQKTIANVLGWSDALLNNDSSGKYDKQIEERKRVITDTINPDCLLLSSALNKRFIPKFKGYENAEGSFDISELPEMQQDIKELVEWMMAGPYTYNEVRLATKYETLDIDGMDTPFIPTGKKRIDDADIMLSDVNKSFDETI